MNRPFQLFRPAHPIFGIGMGMLAALGGCAGTVPADSPRKMTQEEHLHLVGHLSEQISRCIYYEGAAPRTSPVIRFGLNRDGTVEGAIMIKNSSREPSFRPFAEAITMAIRRCQPYKIPGNFQQTYDDWKNISLKIDTSDMQ